MEHHPDPTEAPSTSPSWRSRFGVVVKRMILGVAWLAIWSMTLMACVEATCTFYLEKNEQEGFAAMLGMFGILVLGPVGCLLSYLIAETTSRTGLFLAGAAITGIGTVPLILFPPAVPVVALIGATTVLVLWVKCKRKALRTRP